ncbi:DUF5979 domain-containing protein [Actinotignum sp. GS-2025b]|uniref:DUF5979 domain-containing protein n=1 Tax=Actinotignum sp. GS-2025b TaxID=3427275 RepID=UPI003F4699AA
MPFVPASTAHAAGAATYPVFGSDDDPFPADPQRPTLESDEGAESVAFVFGFGMNTGWATMGGATDYIDNGLCPNEENWPEEYRKEGKRSRQEKRGKVCRNWDQNLALEREIARHRGSSLKVGIYTFARKADVQDGRLWNNTPDLKATSLQSPEGYQKVVDKIRSLDGSKDGKLPVWDHGNNLQYGLGLVYRDMVEYEREQLEKNPGVKPKPLYTKIIVLTHGDNRYYLDGTVKKTGASYEADINALDVDAKFMDYPETWTNWGYNSSDVTRRAGNVAAMGVASLLRGKNADVRVLGMGEWTKRFYYEKSLKTIAEAMVPGQEDRYEHIDFPTKGDDATNYWGTVGGSNYSKNGIANGTFEGVLHRWILEQKSISITSDLIDENFRYREPHRGQQLAVEIAGGQTLNLTTNDLGRTAVRLTGHNTSGGITVRETGSPLSVTSTMLGNEPRCWGIDSRDGQGKEISASALPVDKHGRSGFTLSGDQLNHFYSIKCSLYSRPLQDTQIIKKAQVTNEQIRFEVGGYPHGNPPTYTGGAEYDIEYSCTDPLGRDTKAVIAQGTETRRLENVNVAVTLPAINVGKLPVGAQCTIREKIKMPGGRSAQELSQFFTSSTTLSGTNYRLDHENPQSSHGQSVSAVSTGTVTSAPDSAGGSTGGTGAGSAGGTGTTSTLVSETIYSSQMASVSVDVKFTNSGADPALKAKIAAGELPETVPVYYNCRFMPDPTKPPELPETNQGSYPGFVGAGYVDVPVGGGTITLGKEGDRDVWPVGTHCLFSTVPPAGGAPQPGGAQPAGSRVNVPGFTVTDSFSSDICAADAKERPGEAKQCAQEYFWVHSGGNHKIHITQDLTRQHGTLKVTKQLSGPAQSQGVGQEFPMRMQCTDSGVQVPIGEGADAKPAHDFTVGHGAPHTVTGVPAGAACTITEQATDLATATVAPLAPVHLAPITDVNTVSQVTITNTLDYKYGQVQVSHSSDFAENLTDPQLQQRLTSVEKEVTLTCRLPDGGALPEQRVRVTDSGKVPFPDQIPAGSTCSLSARPTDLGVRVDYRSPSVSITVGADAVTEVDLRTTFELPKAGAINFHPKVQARPGYALLNSKVPATAPATLTCGSVTRNVELDLASGTTTTLSGAPIPENTACSLEVNLGDSPLLSRASQVRIGDELSEKKDGTSAVFEFTSPAADSSLNIEVSAWFGVARTEVTLTSQGNVFTSPNAESQERIPVPSGWKEALFKKENGEMAIGANLVCTYREGGESATESTPIEVRPRSENSTTVAVPFGWTCELAANHDSLQVPGATLVDSRWQIPADRGGQPGTPQAGARNSWVADGPTTAKLIADYRIQLASFNVKKNVGGEGVAIISGSKEFTINISCSLNGLPIDIPAPRKATDTSFDAVGSFGTDLAARLSKTARQHSVTIGRFQQGEWNPIDALPAGAVCTVEETPASVTVEKTQWDKYWQLAAGYRGREAAQACVAGSKACRPVEGAGAETAQVFLPRDTPRRDNPYPVPAAPSGTAAAGTAPAHPKVPEVLPENFAGTMVVWNNYTFQKTKVRVDLTASGTGAQLMNDADYSARLYCRPPVTLTEAEQDALPEGANAAGIIQADLRFTVDEQGKRSAVANQLIPVGYSCVLAQKKLPAYDTRVEATIAAVPGQPTRTAAAEQVREFFAYGNGKSLVDTDTNLSLGVGDQTLLAFTVHPDLTGAGAASEVPETGFSITNLIERIPAQLTAQHILDTPDTEWRTSVGVQLVAEKQLAYTLHYRCQDAYLKEEGNPSSPKITEGSIALPAQSSIAVFGPERFMPASSTCTIWHTVAGADPLADYGGRVHLLPSLKVESTAGTAVTEAKLDAALDTVQASGVQLSETPGSTVTFKDDYFYNRRTYELGSAVVGERAEEVSLDQLNYSYTCKLPLLPGIPAGTTQNGQLSPVVNRAYAQLPVLPAGSVCEVSGNPPAVPRYVRLHTRWVDWGGELGLPDEVADGSGVVDPLTSDSFTHAAANDLTEKPFTVRLDEAHPKGVLLYHAANNGVPVLIQKVDAAGKQVPDASFALYKGSLEAQPEELVREGAAGTYRPAQDLDPGTYYVVNTNAGAHAGQQLPFPFEFTVANGNGVMSLADRTQASGLIQLFTPEGANASGGEQSITATGKWTIQLADVSVGELPHSGGWRPWVIAAGVALLLAALIRMNGAADCLLDIIA